MRLLRLIGVAVAVVLVIGGVFLWRAGRQNPVVHTGELSTDEYDVLSAFIADKFAPRKAQQPLEPVGEGIARIVATNVTQSDEYGANPRLDANGQPIPWTETAKSMLDKTPILQRATIDAFRQVNARQAPLHRSFHTGIDYELVDSAQLDPIFKNGGWPAYYHKFPGSQGILALSRVGFSTDGMQALFYLSNRCGELCGGGRYVVMEKRNGRWAIAKEIEMWVS